MTTVASEEHGQADQSSNGDLQNCFYHLVSLIGAAAKLNEKSTEISIFAESPGAVLDRAKNGSVEVLTHNNENFVILSSAQVVALAQNADVKLKRTMAELYPNLPSLPDSEDRPRYRPLADTVDHLRSRLKD